jgi:RNA polymerase sigma-70 factor, ECF subfamily
VTTVALSLRNPAQDPAAAAPPRPTEGLMSDVARARAGDAGAFRALYEAHVGRVYALCLRLTGQAAEAEETTQDVFVRAWERLATFRGESRFGTWLYRLAVNQVLMRRRTAARRRRRVDVLPEPPDAGVAPRDVETALELEQAIAALPEGCRTVFVLHDIEGWRHEEIAAETGTAVGTSKAHLFRARRLLREALTR